MREYELHIDEALKNGLNPDETAPVNSQLLYECLGFRYGKRGLEAFKPGENPLPAVLNIHYSWPFPQFLCSERYNFVIIRDGILDYIYTVSDDMLTFAWVATVNISGLFEVADFGEYAILTNGNIYIYWNTVTSSWNTSGATATVPMMQTVCNLKGQMVGGGVLSAWYDCDETFYIWSQIGSLNFTPTLDNEASYRRCPYGGEVYNIRRLGDNVVGYSSKGVTLLSPVSSPTTTYRFNELIDVGMCNKGAVNGTLNRHVYVGEDFSIREITQEGVKGLGYVHKMLELEGEDIVVNYDRINKDFYIGNSTKTFLLSPYGLTEVPQHPSAVWRVGKESMYLLPSTIDDYSPLIVTEPFDMEYRGQKTIASIETDAYPVDLPEAGVDYVYDNEDWVVGLYKPINNIGSGAITVVGNSFRFRLRFGELFNGFRIGYMKVRYKMSDLRSIRGVYAPPLRGQ